jgi:LysM repeat protein
MNNPSPLIPQGSLLEQKARGKSHLRVAVFIVAAHLVFLGFLLVGQGCKKDDSTASRSGSTNADTSLPPLTQDTLYNPPTNGLAQATTSSLPTFDSVTTTSQPLTALPAPLPAHPEPLPAAAPANQEYVVVKNDSFYSIGKKFGVTSSAIAKANPGVDSTRLKVGQKLVIPAPAAAGVAESSLGGAASAGDYLVKSGDTLSKISKTTGVSVTEIKSLNGLKTDRIYVGQKLKMPAHRSTPASSPVTVTNPTPAPATPSPTGGASNL